MVKVPRCPYYVQLDHFMLMSPTADHSYVCVKCGHVVIPANKVFQCPCGHCEQMRAFVPFSAYYFNRLIDST
jgi:hypothetical protein